MNEKKPETSIKQEIIDIVINEKGRPIPAGIILRKFKDTHQNDAVNNKGLVYKTIDDLVRSSELKQLKNNSLIMGYANAPADMSKLQHGTISINSAGSGFITLDNTAKATYYVFKTNLNGALNGDSVEFAEMMKPPKRDLKDAIVTKIISHAKNFYVGIIVIEKDGTYKIKVDDEKFYLDIKLDSIQGLVTGQKILIQIGKYENKMAYGTVSRIIGHVGDVGVDILSIVYDNGVEPDFPNEVLEYARNIKLEIDEYQRQIRKDLTNLPIVTIDPATSKDFDDAIYTKKLDKGNFLLSVSIADVSHYVKFKSILDEEALKRGCSIYLVDRVIPMLPHNLSDDLCSLNPDVERLTLTCDTIINSVGAITDIKVYPAIIKSHRRYSYDEVNAFFNGKDKLEKDSDEVKKMLLDSLELHKILDTAKKKRGYINFEIPQPIILVDDKGVPTEIKKYESGTAQKLIEDFMVVANEAVTEYAEKQKWPFVYRVHDKPKDDHLKTFALEAKKLGFKITTDLKDVKPADVARWIKENESNPNLDLINMMLLRTMAKATYEVKNVGHFGLALKNYTHFTSPIRRYPDLLVHRIYWMCEFEKQKVNEGSRREMLGLLSEQANLSSKNELRSVKCERDVAAMKFAEYMEKHIDEEFDGFVTYVSSFGLFVQLENTVEGLIKLVNLKNDYYSFNEKANELIGKKTGIRFTLGTKLRIKVIASNKETRKIEFSFISLLRK